MFKTLLPALSIRSSSLWSCLSILPDAASSLILILPYHLASFCLVIIPHSISSDRLNPMLQSSALILQHPSLSARLILLQNSPAYPSSSFSGLILLPYRPTKSSRCIPLRTSYSLQLTPHHRCAFLVQVSQASSSQPSFDSNQVLAVWL